MVLDPQQRASSQALFIGMNRDKFVGPSFFFFLRSLFLQSFDLCSSKRLAAFFPWVVSSQNFLCKSLASRLASAL